MLRFSPSPTKDLTVSDLRIAIVNYIVSKQLNQDLVVRIDDTDKDAVIEGKDKEILEILNLFSMDYKGVVHQSDSLKYHQKLAMQLMAQKNAFSCFCGDEKLDELKQNAIKEGKVPTYDGFCQTLSDETVLNTNAPFTVRIAKPTENIKFTDGLFGPKEFTPDEIDAFFILNHNKNPTYNYACSLDDMLMNISTVIRDEKHLINTARQIHIRNLLGYDKEINYTHIPSIKNNISVKSLIDEGYLPSAIANYLVLISNKTPKEIFTLEEAIEWFDVKNISKEEIELDFEKLKDLNKQHLKDIEDMRLSKILGFADADLGKLAKLYLDEASTIKDVKNIIDGVFSNKKAPNNMENEFETIKQSLAKAPYIDNFKDLEKYILDNVKISEEKSAKILRLLFTNKENGPDLNEIYPLIKNYLGEILK